jgi:SAM-dependent methyltransferase
MHPSSVENMKRARDLLGSRLQSNLTILDVGGRNINAQDRSYRDIFKDKCASYFIADINPGPNVTHVMPGEYTLPFEDNSIDLIVSGQTLEHVRNPFRSVAEMTRVLKKDHYIILIAPSTGKYHDNPDCWRFMDDAFKAIAAEVGLKVVADWVDLNAPDERSRRWSDHVFVGQK